MKSIFKKICISSDHAGYNIKEFIKDKIIKADISISDLGPFSDFSVDYPDYAKKVSNEINDKGINCIVDLKNHNLNYKIREHSLAKVPILLICGKKEVDSNSVTIRRLDSNKQENMELKTFLKTYSALNKVSN